MNEDTMSRLREVAWHDTLTTDEQVNVERLAAMPPSMAVAYVYTEVMRNIEELRTEYEQSRSAGALTRNIASGAGGGILVALAYLAHALGWDEALR